jgi:hypothetical protein
MSRRLSVAVFLLLCFTTEAGAGPWQVRPVPATLPADENRASGQDESIGSAADYIQTLNRAVTIPRIGMSVRDGRTEFLDGHEVNGVEVIDAAAERPTASSGIQSCRMPREQLAERLEGSSRLFSRQSSCCSGPWIIAPSSMTATSFLPWTARESETFLTLRTGYKVLRAAVAYISRSQGEDDEFKSV